MAAPKLCSIPNCGKLHEARSFCNDHYKSWRKHGDPLKSGQWGKQKVCSIPDCGKKYYAHGLCAMHNFRRRERGSPTAGRVFNGEPLKFFLETVVPFVGDECLPWPYARTPLGYGVMAKHGSKKSAFVHRLACEARHGPPPTPKHQACHNCGNPWCCNPGHSRWDTHKSNMEDKVGHGTQPRGEKIKVSRMTEEDVLYVRSMHRIISQKDLAKHFGVKLSTISEIARRITWKHL